MFRFDERVVCSILIAQLLLSQSYAQLSLEPCEDTYGTSNCEQLKAKNFCLNSNTRTVLKENCAKTCGYCKKSQTTCQNENPLCDDWKDMGLCNSLEHNAIIERQCQVSCELCDEYQTCADLFSESQCRRLVESGKCETMFSMMNRQCKRSCDFCHLKDVPEMVVGWSEWGMWSMCDVVCGDGLRYRSRTCRGSACFGEGTESGPCFVEECPKAVCRTEYDSYCPIYKDLGYCDRAESDEFMEEYCPISCERCTPLDHLSNATVSARYKLCVGRVLNDVVSTSLGTLEKFTVTEEFKAGIINETRLPIEAQDSLRKLSRQGFALTVQDKLFNQIVSGIDQLCGVETTGTRGYIESQLLESKVIKLSTVDCTEWCEGAGTVYRTINGTCNNCRNPLWGSSTTTILRILDAEYEDSAQSLPRGWAQDVPDPQPLAEEQTVPSARLVTKLLLGDQDVLDTRITLMHFQWGQFLDHDLVLIPTNPESAAAGGHANCEKECSNRYPCFPIQLSAGDPITNMTDGVRTCLPFTRSAGIKFSTEGASNYENQISEVTAFVDGSNVYGSSRFLGILLTGNDGKLRTGADECMGVPEGPMLPPCPKSSSTHFCACGLDKCHEKYIAGDARVNEQPMLTLMHTLWMREHNRIAGSLKEINSCWSDEKVFQETRKIVGAMMQHITYRMYLPVLLGPAGFRLYVGFHSKYDPLVHPAILNEFATAAFRFGHSQIPSGVPVLDENWEMVDREPLHGTFFRATMLCGRGFDNILRGLLAVPVNDVDNNFASDVVDRLFAPHLHAMGLDLASINIQRGRDHGIAPYLKYKTYCEHKYKVKAVFRDDHETKNRIRLAYGSLDKLDLFVGGILEEPVHDGLLGPTFSCIIGEQFKRLRDGDRFFYTHAGVFTPPQVQELFKSGMSSVACENSLTVDRVPRRAFTVQEPDQFVECRALPKVNFEKWRECSAGDG